MFSCAIVVWGRDLRDQNYTTVNPVASVAAHVGALSRVRVFI